MCRGFPGGSLVKNPPANAGDARDDQGDPWRRKWQPTPLFLPEASRGQRSLAGYSHEVSKSGTWLSDWEHTHLNRHGSEKSENGSRSFMSDSLWPHGLNTPRHEILQARILEWVALPFSRASSQTGISCIAGRFFTNWATREAGTNQIAVCKQKYFLNCLILCRLGMETKRI